MPKHPLLVPLQVGTALAKERFPGFLHDDIGDNISAKNHSYCELIGQYWAWKNAEADYYGFFHYRRYLYPDITAKRPYIIRRKPTLSLLDKLDYGPFAELILAHDLIFPKGEDMYLPVREHYAAAPFHHGGGPGPCGTYRAGADPGIFRDNGLVFSGSTCYFGNIFIMKREVFLDYCQWLFPILAEFDAQTGTSGYSAQELRADGYLAERLLGVYYTQRKSKLDTLELPRVHFIEDPAEQFKKETMNFILPPGSARRSRIKRLKR